LPSSRHENAAPILVLVVEPFGVLPVQADSVTQLSRGGGRERRAGLIDQAGDRTLDSVRNQLEDGAG